MFDWDPQKAQANQLKHGVSFEEAATAFLDPEGLDGEDLGRPTVGEITHGPDVADGRGRNAGERAPGEPAAAQLHLARDAGALAAVKAKLARNRDTNALFDTARFTRNLENAFTRMVEQQRSGIPPRSFAVEAAS